jgi:hypothetical protein
VDAGIAQAHPRKSGGCGHTAFGDAQAVAANRDRDAAKPSSSSPRIIGLKKSAFNPIVIAQQYGILGWPLQEMGSLACPGFTCVQSSVIFADS